MIRFQRERERESTTSETCTRKVEKRMIRKKQRGEEGERGVHVFFGCDTVAGDAPGIISVPDPEIPESLRVQLRQVSLPRESCTRLNSLSTTWLDFISKVLRDRDILPAFSSSRSSSQS